jgi:signal peptidase II
VRLELLLSAGLVFLMDQLTKGLVVRQDAARPSLRAGWWIEIRPVENRKGCYWLPRNETALLLSWGALFALVIVATRQGYYFQQPAAQLGLGSALGGAAGNLWDCVRRKAVIDFVRIGWWPVFNLADLAITVGAATAMWFI